MFTYIKNKIRIILTIFITLVLVFHFSFVYLYYNTTLNNDFSKKSMHFNMQIAKNTKIRFNQIEEVVTVFTETQPLCNNIKNNILSIPATLSSLNSLDQNIVVSMIQSNKTIIASNSYYMNIYDEFLKKNDLHAIMNKRQSVWCYMDNYNYLIYIKRIKQSDDLIIVFIRDILLRHHFSKKTFFSDNSTTTIQFANNEQLVISNGINAEKIKKPVIIEVEIPEKDIKIKTYASSKLADNEIKLWKIAIFVLLLLSITIAVFVIFRLSNILDNNLTKLLDKIKAYYKKDDTND